MNRVIRERFRADLTEVDGGETWVKIVLVRTIVITDAAGRRRRQEEGMFNDLPENRHRAVAAMPARQAAELAASLATTLGFLVGGDE